MRPAWSVTRESCPYAGIAAAWCPLPASFQTRGHLQTEAALVTPALG